MSRSSLLQEAIPLVGRLAWDLLQFSGGDWDFPLKSVFDRRKDNPALSKGKSPAGAVGSLTLRAIALFLSANDAGAVRCPPSVPIALVGYPALPEDLVLRKLLN